MAYNKTNTSKKHLRTAARMALAWLVLSILAPKGSHSEDSPTQSNNGLESFVKAPDFNSGRAKLIKSQVKEMAGRVVIDSQLEVTQPLQVDKKLNFVSLSTPTATPSSGHAEMWLNNTAKQICTKFDDGSSGCLASGGASGTITSVTAGLGLTGGGGSGAVTVSLSTPITSSYIPDYISGTSVAASTAAIALATTTIKTSFNTYTSTVSVVLAAIGTSTAAIAVDTGTFLTKSSATASYIANSTLLESKTLYVSSGTLTSLNTTTLKFADGTTQTSAAAGFATLVATQTWSGVNTYSSTSTLNGTNLIKGTTVADNARAGDYGEYASTQSTVLRTFATSGQYSDLVSTQVAAGDWDFTACIITSANGATVTNVNFGISQTAGNDSTGLVGGDNLMSVFPPTAATDSGECIPNYRQNVSAATTIYLKQLGIYSLSTPQSKGILKARRRR